jgi:hypothetical protein
LLVHARQRRPFKVHVAVAVKVHVRFTLGSRPRRRPRPRPRQIGSPAPQNPELLRSLTAI